MLEGDHFMIKAAFCDNISLFSAVFFSKKQETHLRNFLNKA